MKSISENWNKGPLEVSSFTARTPEAFVRINFSELSTPAKGNVGSICSRKMADSQQEEWVFCDLTRPSLLPYAQLHGRLKNQEPTVSGNLQPSNHQRRHNRVWTTPKPPPQGISIMIHPVPTWTTSPTRLSLHDSSINMNNIFPESIFVQKIQSQ